MTISESTYIGALRVHSHPGEPDPRQAVAQQLRSADLTVSAMPPSAILIIKKISDPIPNRLNPRQILPFLDPKWERAARDKVDTAFRSAVRPVNGIVPEPCEAVVFRDSAELIACLLRYYLTGDSAPWWMRRLPSEMMVPGDRSPFRLLLQNARTAPSVFGYLHHFGLLERTLACLTPAEARDVALAVCEVYALKGVRDALQSVAFEQPSAAQQYDDMDKVPSLTGANPWHQLFAGPDYGFVHDQTTAKERACLAGLALGLQTNPTLIRAAAWDRLFKKWWTRADNPNHSPDGKQDPSVQKTNPAGNLKTKDFEKRTDRSVDSLGRKENKSNDFDGPEIHHNGHEASAPNEACEKPRLVEPSPEERINMVSPKPSGKPRDHIERPSITSPAPKSGEIEKPNEPGQQGRTPFSEAKTTPSPALFGGDGALPLPNRRGRPDQEPRANKDKRPGNVEKTKFERAERGSFPEDSASTDDRLPFALNVQQESRPDLDRPQKIVEQAEVPDRNSSLSAPSEDNDNAGGTVLTNPAITEPGQSGTAASKKGPSANALEQAAASKSRPWTGPQPSQSDAKKTAEPRSRKEDPSKPLVPNEIKSPSSTILESNSATVVGKTDKPSKRALAFEHGVSTGLGGIFYLINFMDELDMLKQLEPELGESTGAWALLEILARALLQHLAASRSDPYSQDDVWRVLAAADHRDPGAPPDRGLLIPGDYRLPVAWREDPAPSLFFANHDGRGRIWSESGFLMLEAAAKETEQYLAGLTTPSYYAETEWDEAPIPNLTGPLTHPLKPDLQLWLARFTPFLAHRLRIKLGLNDAASTAHALFMHPATLFLTSSHLDVVMDLEEIDINIRVAGLDRDPGWRPHLGKVIYINFR